MLKAGLGALEELGRLTAASAFHRTPAMGEAGRDFANAAALLETDLEPVSLLTALKQMERAFGRRPGRRWGARVLDLDIILWSGGAFAARGLRIPHPHLGERMFVLTPLAEIAPEWRVPGTGRTVRHMHHLLGRG